MENKIDFTKWSVSEIREEIVKLTGMSLAEVENIKGKSALIERLLHAKSVLEGVPNFHEAQIERSTVMDNIGDTNEVEVKPPQIGSNDWQDYVMSILQKDEYDEKNGKKFPKVNGLRRVAQLLLGPIVNSGPVTVFPATGSKDMATVVYSLSILWTYGLRLGGWFTEGDLANTNYSVRTFSEVADSSSDNTPEPFSLHPSATASSRAEGRALRKALQLNTVTAEEMSFMDVPKAKTMDSSDMAKELSTDSQHVLINSMCSRMNIDVNKLLKYSGVSQDLSAVTRREAADIIVSLNKYQSDNAGKYQVPAEIQTN